MTKFACFLAACLLVACGAPKPSTPSLTPEEAAALLQFNNKAEAWITYVKKQNPSCEYKVDLPDQSSHPVAIDVEHIVSCGGRPSPREFDATVSFEFDGPSQKWVISRFSS